MNIPRARLDTRHIRTQAALRSLVCAAALLAVALTACLTIGQQPAIALDAARPFSFTDYDNRDQLVKALLAAIERGTDRAVVERLLVSEGKAVTVPNETRPNVFHYKYERQTFMGPALWSVTVMYDSSSRVRQMKLTGGSGNLFPETPPDDRSDATIFRFEDYGTPDELAETLRQIFPLDTPREDVETVLVKWAGASKWEEPLDPHGAVYAYELDSHNAADGERVGESTIWLVIVRYLKTNTVTQIQVGQTPVRRLYKHDRAYYLRIKSPASPDTSQSSPGDHDDR